MVTQMSKYFQIALALPYCVHWKHSIHLFVHILRLFLLTMACTNLSDARFFKAIARQLMAESLEYICTNCKALYLKKTKHTVKEKYKDFINKPKCRILRELWDWTLIIWGLVGHTEELTGEHGHQKSKNSATKHSNYKLEGNEDVMKREGRIEQTKFMVRGCRWGENLQCRYIFCKSTHTTNKCI